MANRTKNKKNRTKKVNVFNQSFAKNQVNEFDDPIKNETTCGVRTRYTSPLSGSPTVDSSDHQG